MRELTGMKFSTAMKLYRKEAELFRQAREPLGSTSMSAKQQPPDNSDGADKEEDDDEEQRALAADARRALTVLTGRMHSA
jgi:hypothetical protein